MIMLGGVFCKIVSLFLRMDHCCALLQLAIIEAYLPAMMSEVEVKELVDAVVSELKASSLKDMGKVMGAMQVSRTWIGLRRFGPQVKGCRH